MIGIWKNWCKLCGSHDKLDAADLLINNKFKNSHLKDILLQYFTLSMNDIEISLKLCFNCAEYLTSLYNFRQKVSKIQQMYRELEFEENLGNEVDINAIRKKFGLSDLKEINCKFENIPTDEDSNILHNDFKNLSSVAALMNSQDSICVKKEVKPLLNKDMLNENDCQIVKSEIGQVNTILCEACPKVFAQISRYLLHLKKKHNIVRDPPPKSRRNNPDDRIICKLCGKSCGNRGAYVSHMQKKHENAELEEPKLYECRICTKTFTQKMALTKHEEIHLPKEQRNLFPCLQCSKKFLNEYLLEAHIKIVHLKEKPFICEICGKATTSKRSLEDHKLVHMEAALKCSLCSQLFKNNQRLKVHMKTHENFNVPCLICNVRLKNNQSLREHMLVHTDTKNFKCPLCQNAFRCRRNLRAHMLTHTGLKPYHCSFCEVSYANRSNCKKHEKHAHPTEFAEMEAKGMKVHSKNVPKFHELKQMMEQMKHKEPLHS